jgi:ribokinase
MSRIIAVGDLVTDVVAVLAGPLARGSDTPARIQATGGGQAANTAAWLAWTGVPVTLVAAVGRDDAGDTLVAEMVDAGVDCAVVRRPDAPTGSILVLVEGGERTMVTDRRAGLLLAPGDIDAALAGAGSAGHLHLSAYLLLDAASRDAGLHALAAARGRGLTTSVDAASAAPLRRVGAAAFLEWVAGADILLAGADEAEALVGAGSPRSQAVALAGATRVAAVVKAGAAGAVWAGADGPVVEASSLPVAVVDPTGAGDAFAAGLLAALAAGVGPATALRQAVQHGALAVGLVGARPPRR